MTTLHPTQDFTLPVLPEVRRIRAADLDWALREGWRDFASKRGDLLFAGVIYPVIGFAAAAFALDTELLPLLFPMVAGISILGPAVASGFYELARRREQGLEAGWSHFLDPLRGRSRVPVLTLTLLLLGLFAAWMAAAWMIYQVTLAPELLPYRTPVDQFLHALFGTPAGWQMIVIGNLIGLGFAMLTLVLTVVSFPMVIDQPVDAGTAVSTSLAAVRANPGAIAGWGLRVAVLLALGALPAFIGLAVVLPVLGYATWHLYTRLVER